MLPPGGPLSSKVTLTYDFFGVGLPLSVRSSFLVPYQLLCDKVGGLSRTVLIAFLEAPLFPSSCTALMPQLSLSPCCALCLDHPSKEDAGQLALWSNSLLCLLIPCLLLQASELWNDVSSGRHHIVSCSAKCVYLDKKQKTKNKTKAQHRVRQYWAE